MQYKSKSHEVFWEVGDWDVVEVPVARSTAFRNRLYLGSQRKKTGAA
jgi:hypothetical protein